MPAAAEARRRGEAAARSGDLRSAIAHFRQAAALRPADGGAQIALGRVLAAAGYLHDGCAALAVGARLLPPADRQALLDAAALLQQFGDPARALAPAQAVAATDPTNTRAHHLVAAAAAQLGQGALALEAIGTAARLAPADPALAVLAASIAVDFGDAAAAAADLRERLTGPLPPREAFRAAKELGRALDRVGDYPAVFPALAQAAALAPQVPGHAALDPQRNARTISADLAAIDPAMLRRWAADEPADGDAAPIFVIGFLRSGTTLMQEVLGVHPAVCIADEAPLLALTAAQFERRAPGPDTRMNRLDRLTPADRAALRGYYHAAAAAHLGPAAQGQRLVDKFALNLIDLPLILRLFPNSPVLFMVRDPRDACLSALLQLMVPTEATINLLEPERAAAFHALICGAWRQWRDVVPAGQLAEVRYEALVTDFEPTVRAALAHVGLDWTDAMRSFHRSAGARYISSPSRLQVASPLTSGAIGRWRHYAAQFEPLLPHLAPSLAAWDYPPS